MAKKMSERPVAREKRAGETEEDQRFYTIVICDDLELCTMQGSHIDRCANNVHEPLVTAETDVKVGRSNS